MSAPTQILYAAVPSSRDQVEQLLSTLEAAQQTRAVNFRPKRKAQFVSGRTLMMRYLHLTAASNHNIQEHSDSGPILTINQQVRYTSVSHTSEVVAVAFAGQPIGLDLEVIRKGWSPEKVKLFCTEAELKTGLALETDKQNEFFTRCWVRKEAYSKCHGLSVWSKRTRMTCLLNDNFIRDLELASSGDVFPLHLAALYGGDEFQLREISF